MHHFARAVYAACWDSCFVVLGSFCLHLCVYGVPLPADVSCCALHAVLLPLQVCQVLGIPIDEDALRAADGKPNDGTGMDEDGSDEVRMAWRTRSVRCYGTCTSCREMDSGRNSSGASSDAARAALQYASLICSEVRACRCLQR
jgi:hypothetical protein